MAFIMVRQIKQYENQTGTTIQLPNQVLNSMGVSPEDWEMLWRNSGTPVAIVPKQDKDIS